MVREFGISIMLYFKHPVWDNVSIWYRYLIYIYISVYIHTGRVEADNQFSVDPSLAQTGQKKQGRFRNRRNGSSCNSNHSQQRHTYWWQKILKKNHHQTTKVPWLIGGLEHEFYFPFHIWDVILLIDFHIFQRGWNHQPPDVLFSLLSLGLRRTAGPLSFQRQDVVFVVREKRHSVFTREAMERWLEPCSWCPGIHGVPYDNSWEFPMVSIVEKIPWMSLDGLFHGKSPI